MHPRHRSPGNGYRSNPMGIGMASRISPESSGRGHNFYNSEYRSFNRSFGRSYSQPKPFHPSPPPRPPQHPVAAPLRKADLFMEAGRLAAEYLVYQGMLPSGALLGKWQNGNFKEPQEFRSQEGDAGHNMQFPVEGRGSSLGRSGDSGSDGGPSRRRYSDEYGPAGFRNNTKGKRRGGSFRGYNSEWGREYGRSSSWSDRRRGSPSIDADREYNSGNREEQSVTKNDGNLMQKSSNEVMKNEESGGVQESETKEHESKATSSVSEKEVRDETDGAGGGGGGGGGGEPLNKNDELSIPKENTDEMKDKDDPSDGETRKEIISEELLENKPSEKLSVTDLQSLCKFANMPTKTRSVRGARVSEEEKNCDASTSQVSEVLMEDKAVDSSIKNVGETRGLELEISEVGTLQAAEVVNPVDRSLMLDDNQEVSEKRGEKRVIEESNTNEDIKRLREWLPSMDAEVAGGPTTDEKPIMVVEQHQESTKNNPQMSEIGEESFAQEKQLFPSSFKICDLNLMETSDANETRDRDPIFMFPPVTDFKKEVGPVDIDLSISNSSMSSQPAKKVDDTDQAIEVINLDEDSAPEDREFDITERKPDVAFTGLDGFSTNPVQNATDIPDNQDGYGLMISELLANEFSGCSSVPEEINPLDNMGLNGGAGPLGDDDSIYMSLGEIPFLSFMRTWEQPPPQEDGKPF
ncbi:uncharacterized protein At4g26450 [Punica granatum]|uniref:Uncharacterized protein At4g26450 n=1 Tax=Punica granatum TaxID=22663 RepID=A0A6P8E889_PUNGR|nr:uncharacterized protein At4g26450 [Punica granatum]